MKSTRLWDSKGSSQGISAIHAEIGAGDVFRGITQKKGDSPHQIFRGPHFADRD